MTTDGGVRWFKARSDGTIWKVESDHSAKVNMPACDEVADADGTPLPASTPNTCRTSELIDLEIDDMVEAIPLIARNDPEEIKQWWSKMLARVHQLEREKSELANAVETLTKERAAFHAAESPTTIVDSTGDGVAEALFDLVATGIRENESWTHRTAGYEALKELRRHFAELQAENVRLQVDDVKAISDLEQQLAAQAERVAELEAYKKGREKIDCMLNSDSLSDIVMVQGKALGELKTENEQVKQQLATLRAENVQLKRLGKNVDSTLREQLAAQAARVEELECECTAHRERVEEFDVMLVNAESNRLAWAAKCSDLEQQLATLQADYERLKAGLSYVDYLDKYKATEAERDQLRGEVERFKRDNNSFFVTTEEFNQLARALHLEEHSPSYVFGTAPKLIDQLRTALADSERQYERLRKDGDALAAWVHNELDNPKCCIEYKVIIRKFIESLNALQSQPAPQATLPDMAKVRELLGELGDLVCNIEEVVPHLRADCIIDDLRRELGVRE